MSMIAVLGLALANVATLPQTPDGAPPPEMKQIEFLLGDWSGKETYHMMGQATETTATINFKKTLVGRYFQMTHKAKMPGFGDTEGLMLVTYDSDKKKFMQYWFDSTAAGSMESEGSLNGNTLLFESKPTMMMGESVTFRSTFVKKSDKNVTFLLEMKQGEQWATFIEGSYNKK